MHAPLQVLHATLGTQSAEVRRLVGVFGVAVSAVHGFRGFPSHGVEHFRIVDILRLGVTRLPHTKVWQVRWHDIVVFLLCVGFNTDNISAHSNGDVSGVSIGLNGGCDKQRAVESGG